ncbi:hypothetical protein AAFX24_28475 [Vibrio mediterranei]|uniref:hypothetical protein n=1 Tax=Vibrio mediterranei TaxID=689 RepID=UPI0038CDCB9E
MKAKVITTSALVLASANAYAATGIEFYIEKVLTLLAWCAGAGIIYLLIWGIVKGIQAVLMLQKMGEQQVDPDLGRKLGTKVAASAAAIGFSILIVALVFSMFGTTAVLDYMLPGGSTAPLNPILDSSQSVGGS